MNESFVVAVVGVHWASHFGNFENPRTLKNILTYNRLHDQCCNLQTAVFVLRIGQIHAENRVAYMRVIVTVRETGRPLVARIREHMRAQVSPSMKSYVNAPLARRRVVAHHQRIPKIYIKVLDLCVDTVRLKALEGTWMKWTKLGMSGRRWWRGPSATLINFKSTGHANTNYANYGAFFSAKKEGRLQLFEFYANTYEHFGSEKRVVRLTNTVQWAAIFWWWLKCRNVKKKNHKNRKCST